MDELFSLLNFLEPSRFSNQEEFNKDFGNLQTEDQVEKLQVKSSSCANRIFLLGLRLILQLVAYAPVNRFCKFAFPGHSEADDVAAFERRRREILGSEGRNDRRSRAYQYSEESEFLEKRGLQLSCVRELILCNLNLIPFFSVLSCNFGEEFSVPV